MPIADTEPPVAIAAMVSDITFTPLKKAGAWPAFFHIYQPSVTLRRSDVSNILTIIAATSLRLYAAVREEGAVRQ